MTFNTDSHFVIGRYHIRQNKPCQDHALDCTQDSGKVGIAVVSDGCSSGRHTDIGARVITCSAIRELNKTWFSPHDHRTPQFMAGAIIDSMIHSKSVLALDTDDMLATCGYALMDERGGLIHLLGDGCVAIKYTDGAIHCTTLDWQYNTPFYLVYDISSDQVDFKNIHLSHENGEKAMKITDLLIFPDGGMYDIDERFMNLTDAIKGYTRYPKDPQTIECIAIFSDGVQDFQKGESERIPVEKVVYEMMNFKNYIGEFVKRRISAQLKAFAKEDIHPGDDFSMAVIHFNNESTEYS